MSVAKVIEIIASSKKSWEDAASQGIERASSSLDDITGAWVKDQSVKVKNGKVVEFRVTLKVTFLIDEKKAKRNK